MHYHVDSDRYVREVLLCHQLVVLSLVQDPTQDHVKDHAKDTKDTALQDPVLDQTQDQFQTLIHH